MEIDVHSYIKSIAEENVMLGVKAKSKKGGISLILDHIVDIGGIEKGSKKNIMKAIMQREEMGSTAIGGGIALPHVRTDRTDNIVVCVAISQEGIEFNALDQEPVHVVVMLISPQKEAGVHLKMLALLARMLKDKYFIQCLKEVKSKKDVIAMLARQQLLVR